MASKARMLASPNRSAENIGVHPVVIPELELIDIQRKIFVRNFMERADDPALHQRPETFDGLRVNCANNVFSIAMIDYAVRKLAFERLIAAPCIGANQTYLCGHRFTDKAQQRGAINVLDNLGN